MLRKRVVLALVASLVARRREQSYAPAGFGANRMLPGRLVKLAAAI
jgi:hypothetical protein